MSVTGYNDTFVREQLKLLFAGLTDQHVNALVAPLTADELAGAITDECLEPAQAVPLVGLVPFVVGQRFCNIIPNWESAPCTADRAAEYIISRHLLSKGIHDLRNDLKAHSDIATSRSPTTDTTLFYDAAYEEEEEEEKEKDVAPVEAHEYISTLKVVRINFETIPCGVVVADPDGNQYDIPVVSGDEARKYEPEGATDV